MIPQRLLAAVRRFIADRRGQTTAEYSLLTWVMLLVGTLSLVTMFFAFEEGVIAYYEDIVNTICLPIP